MMFYDSDSDSWFPFVGAYLRSFSGHLLIMGLLLSGFVTHGFVTVRFCYLWICYCKVLLLMDLLLLGFVTHGDNVALVLLQQ